VNLRKEVCWVISNITAGNAKQLDAAIKADLFQALVKVCLFDKDAVAREAAWALSNATTSDQPNVLQFLVHVGVVGALGKQLGCSQVRTLAVCLEGIENILAMGDKVMEMKDMQENPWIKVVEEAHVLDKLEQIQSNMNIPEKLQDKAAELVRKYFEGEEVEVDDDEVIEGQPQREGGSERFNGDDGNFGDADDGGFSFGWNNEDNGGGDQDRWFE